MASTGEATISTVKASIAREVETLHSRLIDLAHDLHANPEVGFHEHHAARLLTGELESEGFTLERGVAGLETAFVATWGGDGPAVGFLAEYDALAGLGHACGHNLIAAWAVGAGVALKRALADSRAAITIKVIGTPAEEDGGGKVIMAEAGVFRGLDAAIMIHPRDANLLDRGSLALTPYTVEFFGRSAHASSYPERGISALDGVLHLFFSVNAFRQMLRPRARMHGIISHGGDAPNIVPEYAAARFIVRSADQEYQEELRTRFRTMVEAAALATGTTFKISEGVSYQTRASNRVLLDLYRENLEAMGLDYEIPPADAGVGSSDIGNVSQLVPTIHPYLAICEKGIPNHNPRFAEEAATERADRAIATGCTLMAWTAADVLLRPEKREQVRGSFRDQLGREPQK